MELNNKKVGEISDKKDFWLKQISIEEKYERQLIAKLKDIFRDQEKQVLSRLRGATKECLVKSRQGDGNEHIKYWHEMKLSIPRILLNIKKENKKIVKQTKPITENSILEIGQFTLDEMGIDETFASTGAVKEYLKTNPIKFANSVNITTNKSIRRTLSAGIADGEGIAKLTKRVERVFDVATRSRALSIARTETSRAVNFATVEAYKQSEVVEGKEWLTALDERTCERCEAMDGKKIGLDDNFFDKDDSFMGIKFDYDEVAQPPLHVSCRCTTVPIV